MTIRTAIFASALLCAAQAQAADLPCGNTLAILKEMAEKYHEAPILMALANKGSLLQVYGNKDTDTWTAIKSMPNGMSCIVGAGNHFMVFPDASLDPPA